MHLLKYCTQRNAVIDYRQGLERNIGNLVLGKKN